MTYTGFLVTEDIRDCHPREPKFFLIEGDLITKDEDGSWRIQCPGIMIAGFQLTPEQEATLKEVQYVVNGLAYMIVSD